MRTDARRNYERLLAVAEEQVAEHGADASMEQIARLAGVGSGTARRHFPTRQVMLEAVFRERVDALATQAEVPAAVEDPVRALIGWLEAVLFATSTFRGLAEALARENATPLCATGRLAQAGRPLVSRAGASLQPGVTIGDLLDLVTGIALATEHRADREEAVQRLLRLAIDGVCRPA
ncbi:TetR family transcriptional regulator [Kineosporia sp. J2-2]|uniref:TetR family transcriptional regulator n=1 Tax=Kineosporia corallincola TaxID=2835133 RepID=A0ABS5TC82_9ACTN|nr:helix-turn-helix domain-containing protein [Kineosporia corallincola]MBT0768691.1 TetR family transcriptional regulator [Kineosporia corallincola]